jgi:phosphoenolpyruvate carboxykinase (ATP)
MVKEQLREFNIEAKGEVHRNLDVNTLLKKSVERKEGVISKTGSLTVTTGKYTGRSPNDRFIVDTPDVHDEIAWGKVNMPLSEEYFDKLYEKITKHMSGLDELFVFDGFAGADKKHTLHIRVVNEFSSQNLFIHQLLRRPNKEELESHDPKLTILAAPGCIADPESDGTNSEAFVVINLKKKVVIIGGTSYAGEIKKSIFSVMNYFLPKKGVLPMHCSANMGKDSQTALFFGLSGTGKTTLSADENRILIGDDEHGWSENGIFNFEGGCYAKCIDLSKENEPQIYNAIRDGALVENVVMDPKTLEYDFADNSLTENTRAAYPLEYIPNSEVSGVGGHPKTIIFLTADASGVMPPVAKLDPTQAMYHFMSGYTSKLAGTERGITEPVATFSSFFGEPFMPLKPMVYANLLKQYLEKYNSSVFLINTGWTGGPYGTGERISIKDTRKMVTAALNSDLDSVEYEHHEIFNLDIPKSCPDVESKILKPQNTWESLQAYEKKANELAALFQKNIEKFSDVTDEIKKSGPKAL